MMLGLGRVQPSTPTTSSPSVWCPWSPRPSTTSSTSSSWPASNLLRSPNPFVYPLDPLYSFILHPRPPHLHVGSAMTSVANGMAEEVNECKRDVEKDTGAENNLERKELSKESVLESKGVASNPFLIPTTSQSLMASSLPKLTTTTSRRSSSSSLSSLSRPMTNRGAARHVCPHSDCGYRSNRKNNLKRHMETMHERLGSPQLCCGLIFSHKAELKRHVRESHNKGYVCKMCNKRFARKGLLDRHVLVHGGLKTHGCHLCDYASCHRSNLERHLRTHHQQIRGRNDN